MAHDSERAASARGRVIARFSFAEARCALHRQADRSPSDLADEAVIKELEARNRVLSEALGAQTDQRQILRVISASPTGRRAGASSHRRHAMRSCCDAPRSSTVRA
jgi:hypothetical protein